jgi:hypothetical protein
MAILESVRIGYPWIRRGVGLGVLTDRQIKRAREHGELRIDPFDETLLRPAAISLRLGREGAVTLVPRVLSIRRTGKPTPSTSQRSWTSSVV